jgi:hypothetical protein
MVTLGWVSMAETVAPGTTAPVASLAVPEIVLRSDCPNNTAHDTHNHTSNRVAGEIRLISIIAYAP